MAKVKDPVCGMEFDSSQAEAQATYKGQAYYFCSAACRETFDENPESFLRATRDGEPEAKPPGAD
jgi:Cu+-exporting ATPase